MARVSVEWADDELKRLNRQVAALNQRFGRVVSRIVNQVGDRAKTQVIRALTQQTGLKRATIVKAVGDPGRARPGKLSYDMVTRGGDIRLKYLAPRETRAGVVARPWGKAKLYPHSFMKGGAFPNRKEVPKFQGHVKIRIFRGAGVSGGERGRRLTFVRSGMRIPDEMVTGNTRRAFLNVAENLLRERIDAAFAKLIG